MGKRILSILVAAVLCLCFIQPPKSQAVAAEVGLVVAGSVAAAPVAATIGVICLAVVGVGFLQGAFDNTDSIYYGTAVYDWGYKFAQACEAAGGAVHDWYVAQVAACADGLAAGQQIAVPAEVAEYARQWAVENIDFTAGGVSVTQYGIFSDSGVLLFTDKPDSLQRDQWATYRPTGSLYSVSNPYFDLAFQDANSITWHYFTSYDESFKMPQFTISSSSGSGCPDSLVDEDFMMFFWVDGYLEPGFYGDTQFLFPGFYNPSTGDCKFKVGYRDSGLPLRYMAISSSNAAVATMTKEPALDVPIADDLVATIPDDIPFVQVEDKAIPVISDLTREDVLTGEVVEPTDPPLVTDPPIDVPTDIPNILTGFWDTVKAIPKTIVDGIISGIKALFLPTEEALTKFSNEVDTKLPLISDLKRVGADLADTLENPSGSAADLRMTTIVDLGKKADGSFGGAKINLLDVTWYLEYRDFVNDIIVGFAWLVFLWNLYGALPGIIHGGASGLHTTAQLQREIDYYEWRHRDDS